MALAVKISPEELLEFKRDFEELMEAFYNTVLTQGQNVCITNLSCISEYYINIHIYYQKNKWQDSADRNNGRDRLSL